MQFNHPVNDYTLIKNNPGIWTFLFGPLYFLGSEIYNQAILMALVTAVVQTFALLTFGGKGWAVFIGILLVHGIYAVLAEALVEAHYRRHGWTVD